MRRAKTIDAPNYARCNSSLAERLPRAHVSMRPLRFLYGACSSVTLPLTADEGHCTVYCGVRVSCTVGHAMGVCGMREVPLL